MSKFPSIASCPAGIRWSDPFPCFRSPVGGTSGAGQIRDMGRK
jgi:hypothetical protein